MEIIKGKNIKLNYLINLLKKGMVLVVPTDTVYGIICDSTNQKAINSLFKIKERPKNKPLPIFVKDIKMAKRIAFIDREQEKYLKSVWPGKVTVILKPRKKLPFGIGKRGREVGLRVPKNKLINNLL